MKASRWRLLGHVLFAIFAIVVVLVGASSGKILGAIALAAFVLMMRVKFELLIRKHPRGADITTIGYASVAALFLVAAAVDTWALAAMAAFAAFKAWADREVFDPDSFLGSISR